MLWRIHSSKEDTDTDKKTKEATGWRERKVHDGDEGIDTNETVIG